MWLGGHFLLLGEAGWRYFLGGGRWGVGGGVFWVGGGAWTF